MRTWGLTGCAPNPLADVCDEAVAVDAATTATVQEVHLVLVHLLAGAVDVALGVAPAVVSLIDAEKRVRV
jgi:D-sedoheptulose 7-phosphate isomerase